MTRTLAVFRRELRGAFHRWQPQDTISSAPVTVHCNDCCAWPDSSRTCYGGRRVREWNCSVNCWPMILTAGDTKR